MKMASYKKSLEEEISFLELQLDIIEERWKGFSFHQSQRENSSTTSGSTTPEEHQTSSKGELLVLTKEKEDPEPPSFAMKEGRGEQIPKEETTYFEGNSLEFEITTFNGREVGESLVVWLIVEERVFELLKIQKKRKVELVVHRLRKQAPAWWTNLGVYGERKGVSKINGWEEMKRALRDEFLPYKNKALIQFSKLKQDSRPLGEYVEEVENWMLRCDIEREDSRTLGHFLKGLDVQLVNLVKQHEFSTFDELLKIAKFGGEPTQNPSQTPTTNNTPTLLPTNKPIFSPQAPKTKGKEETTRPFARNANFHPNQSNQHPTRTTHCIAHGIIFKLTSVQNLEEVGEILLGPEEGKPLEVELLFQANRPCCNPFPLKKPRPCREKLKCGLPCKVHYHFFEGRRLNKVHVLQCHLATTENKMKRKKHKIRLRDIDSWVGSSKERPNYFGILLFRVYSRMSSCCEAKEQTSLRTSSFEEGEDDGEPLKHFSINPKAKISPLAHKDTRKGLGSIKLLEGRISCIHIPSKHAKGGETNSTSIEDPNSPYMITKHKQEWITSRHQVQAPNYASPNPSIQVHPSSFHSIAPHLNFLV